MAENFKNLLVFDSSSSNIFFGGISRNATFFEVKNFEKSKLSRFLPEEFIKVVSKHDFSELPRIIIGNGPGTFTGIKSGAAFFLAFVYSLGIKTVETVSSFSFVSSLFDFTDTDLRIVLIPFNKGEYFAALIDNNNHLLLKDLFFKPPYESVSSVFAGFSGAKIDIAAPIFCGSEILPALEKTFKIENFFFENFTFNPQRFKTLPDTKCVDITTEPFIINHIIAPANLNDSGNFYVKNPLGR